MRTSTKIPGFHYVGTTSDPAYVLDTEPGEPFRIRIEQVTPRKWAVQVGGRTRFEVNGLDAAVREARRLAAEVAAEDVRVLAIGKKRLASRHHATKSPARRQIFVETETGPGRTLTVPKDVLKKEEADEDGVREWLNKKLPGNWQSWFWLDEHGHRIDAAMKKSPAQLQRDIDEVIARTGSKRTGSKR